MKNAIIVGNTLLNNVKEHQTTMKKIVAVTLFALISLSAQADEMSFEQRQEAMNCVTSGGEGCMTGAYSGTEGQGDSAKDGGATPADATLAAPGQSSVPVATVLSRKAEKTTR
jgi:hypothetical protein